MALSTQKRRKVHPALVNATIRRTHCAVQLCAQCGYPAAKLRSCKYKQLIQKLCVPWTPWTNCSMFGEYLEMVLQFGFITLFGLAFPLAPLLALINNVIEVRLDAIKMLRLFRRPVAQRAANIGVWFSIMTIVTRIAVASSAMIIAFSTNLIPKLVYKTATHDESLNGYLNFILAFFHTNDFKVQPVLTGSPYVNVTSCRYTEFQNPPWDPHPYKRPMIYWKILTARLAFIVIFQNIIGMIQAIIAWATPDVPAKLRKRVKREDFLLREHIIETGKKFLAERTAGLKCIAEAAEERERNDANNSLPAHQRNGRSNGRGGGIAGAAGDSRELTDNEEEVVLRKRQAGGA